MTVARLQTLVVMGVPRDSVSLVRFVDHYVANCDRVYADWFNDGQRFEALENAN
jgi:hypothetical protein